MTTPQRVEHDVDDVVLGARRVRAAVSAAAHAPGPVRLVVAGPRGSAKSAVLDHLGDHAARADRVVVRLAPGDDPSEVPADSVLLADDLHALDDLTLDALARRAADTSASLVVTIRPWSRSVAARRIAHALEQSRPALVLGQVSRADILDHRPGALAAPCVDWVLQATGGVSWLVAAALAAHDDRDCAGDPQHLELDRLLAATIAHRLAAVDEDVRLAVEHACADLGAGSSQDSLRHAYAEGLLLRDGRPAPIVRSAIDSGPSSPGLADRAVTAFAAGDLDAAAFLVDLARALPADGSADRLTAVAAATWAARGMLDIAARLYATADDAAGLNAEIAAVGSGLVPDAPAASVTSAGATSTQQIAADLLREGLRASLVADRSDVAVASLARASHLHTASRSTDPLPELPAVIAAAAAQSHGDPAGARASIDAAVAGRQGGHGAAPRLLLWRAWLAMHQVRSREARESLAAATAAASVFSPRDEFVAHAVRLGLARRYGDASALAAAWEAARPALLAIDVDLYLLQPLTEFVAAAARLRDTEATDAATSRAVDLLARLGEPPLWSNPVRWSAIQRGILVKDPGSLAPHAHALSAAAAHSPIATTMAAAGRVWTAVLGGTVDADEVERAAAALAGVGLTWDAARLAGSAAGLADDRRVSARLLSRARDIHPLDVARTVGRPAGDVAGTAESPSPATASGLSPRELDVARLVVEGKTYAEIGAAIFISPRTAEHHIASIRRRLGATSRSDLIAKLTATLASDLAGSRAVA